MKAIYRGSNKIASALRRVAFFILSANITRVLVTRAVRFIAIARNRACRTREMIGLRLARRRRAERSRGLFRNVRTREGGTRFDDRFTFRPCRNTRGGRTTKSNRPNRRDETTDSTAFETFFRRRR